MKFVKLSMLAFVLCMNLLVATAGVAQAQTNCPPNTAARGGVCFPTGTGLSEASVTSIIQTFLYWLLGIFGFLAIIAFVISGIQYLTSAGNDKQIETAKKNMQYSIIGVIVALAGMVIVTAVEAALTGGNNAF